MKESMRRKGVVAAAVTAVCITMLILLSSGQTQQVSARSKISRCYDGCMPDCEPYSPLPVCKFFCITCCVVKGNHDCSRPGGEPPAAAFAGDGCTELCVSSIRGGAATGEPWATDAGVAAACVDGCNIYWSKKKN